MLELRNKANKRWTRSAGYRGRLKNPSTTSSTLNQDDPSNAVSTASRVRIPYGSLSILAFNPVNVHTNRYLSFDLGSSKLLHTNSISSAVHRLDNPLFSRSSTKSMVRHLVFGFFLKGVSEDRVYPSFTRALYHLRSTVVLRWTCLRLPHNRHIPPIACRAPLVQTW